ncbi:hypothetical protein NIES4071_94790 [Calothrix sp. NIES-4071]|nr:hypothetical protein NIES4071_94790 [Calothrix sp. NIES-4071]BAZ63744.1 hypothetical protein NIES4105_94720 [Calothrix sp. NIES-4105]
MLGLNIKAIKIHTTTSCVGIFQILKQSIELDFDSVIIYCFYLQDSNENLLTC